LGAGAIDDGDRRVLEDLAQDIGVANRTGSGHRFGRKLLGPAVVF
jgi:hypothetical protein